VVVPYPPPPARVELIPPAPSDTAVWVDGTWRWTGRDYIWIAGRWQEPIEEAHYAPAKTERLPDGGVSYSPGTYGP